MTPRSPAAGFPVAQVVGRGARHPCDDRAQASAIGQLVIEDFAAAYDGPGQLDLDQMESGFRAAGRRARADGFGGLRVAAEMGDFSRAIGSVERLLDWERTCTSLQHD